MGESAYAVSDKWDREIERHIYSEANSIACGPAQDCSSAEIKMGAGQSTTEEGSVSESRQSPPFRVAGHVVRKTSLALASGYRTNSRRD